MANKKDFQENGEKKTGHKYKEGNEYWKLRLKCGKDKKLTPEEVAEGAFEYVSYCIDNPMYKYDTIRSGDSVGQEIKIKVERPITIVGLCVHLGVTPETFRSYKKDPAYVSIVTRTIEIIRSNQLEGGITGIYNSSIIARILGIPDTFDLKVDDKRKSVAEMWPDEKDMKEE